jgi:hypothetical protein
MGEHVRLAKNTTRRHLGLHVSRLYVARLLTAISGIAIVLALVSLWLNLDDLYEANEHALLLLLPAAAYQLGKMSGSFLPQPR